LIDVCKKIELQYSYNFDKAKSMVTEEMEKLGAKLTNGKWYYKGEPVTIIMLIRVEDERRQMGDYFANQLEKLGFTVDRQYKTSAEAAPLWAFGDPAEGKWHVYTGGWITTAISRDEATVFGDFYTPMGWSVPLWQAYNPDPEFYEIAKRLYASNYTTWEERNQLMARALELSMKDSVRIWLVSTTAAHVARKEVTLAYDLAGGFYGARPWPYTIRFKDKIGGTIRIITQASFPTEPWNPLGGTNWIYDAMIYRATYDPVLMPDPYTGLYWPLKVSSAEVYVRKGTPVTKTLDWLTLHFSDEIVVPTDAWYDWNATAQEIVTAPEETKAKAKVVVHFRDDLFEQKMHDGSKISLADFIYNYIITFDTADPASPIYDESVVASFQAFRSYFKGFRIISEDPLVCEFYTDLVYPDAEWIVADVANWFDPTSAFGPSPWHTVAIGMLAEENGLAAFTADKADTLGVDRLNYVAGGTLNILSQMLDEAIANKYIPYKNILGKYISEDEALARYQALKAWYESKGHFWVGDGPFYLESVDPTANIAILKANREYPDKADKWAIFGEPKMPETRVEAPTTVINEFGAKISVEITCKGEPYKIEDIDSVKYLIVDASGNVSVVGTATPMEDGLWSISLEPKDLTNLLPGSSKLLVAVSSKLMSIPSTKEVSFTAFSLEGYVAGKVGAIQAQIETRMSSLENTVESLEDQVSTLQSSLATLNTLAMASIGIAVIAIIIAGIAVTKKK